MTVVPECQGKLSHSSRSRGWRPGGGGQGVPKIEQKLPQKNQKSDAIAASKTIHFVKALSQHLQ